MPTDRMIEFHRRTLENCGSARQPSPPRST
jgi:hypothetical protein